MEPELRDRLARRLRAVGAPADDRALAALSGWFDLHAHWARAYNLTGTRDGEQLVDLHLADCAALVPLLPAGRLLDLGSGAGLPGLIIALLEPDRPLVLLDSASKRTRFLEQVVLELCVRNVRVVTARIESWRPEPDQPLAGVLVRAVAPLAKLVRWTRPLLAAGTPLLAMKGPAWPAEAESLPEGYRVTQVSSYALPGTERDHALIRVEARPAEVREADPGADTVAPETAAERR